ncbi:MAG: simple sugar transport system substrate-binding protein [Solirubrobacteraceae bacterium]|nr:simple sugar transport system substrate-binding protein [Solirubrobacteraceae bacterium]
MNIGRTRSLAGFAALLVAMLLLVACGKTTTVREQSLDVSAGDEAARTTASAPARGDAVTIAVVTHGQASSPFWAIVRNGVEAAARQMDVLVSYRAPDVYSIDRMKAMVDEAIANKPDGLVISLPEPAMAPVVRRAVRAGIPVVTINSGSDLSRKLGVLAHVGQPERRAGLVAGRRLAAGGVRRALCVNQQIGNLGLDARCAGLAEAMRDAGGRSTVIGVDDQSPATPRRLATAITRERIDGMLTLNSTTGLEALEAAEQVRGRRSVKIATFDLGPDVLKAVRDGRISFAVDQQAYLQGYLPVTLLAQRARYGLFPDEGGIIATGPHFVTRGNAAQAIELSRRSIR